MIAGGSAAACCGSSAKKPGRREPAFFVAAGALPNAAKSAWQHHYNLLITKKNGGPGGCAGTVDFIGFLVGQNQKSSRIAPYGSAPKQRTLHKMGLHAGLSPRPLWRASNLG